MVYTQPRISIFLNSEGELYFSTISMYFESFSKRYTKKLTKIIRIKKQSNRCVVINGLTFMSFNMLEILKIVKNER